MANLQRLATTFLLAVLLLAQCDAFNVVQKRIGTPLKTSSIQTSSSYLFSNSRSNRNNAVFMTEEPKDQEEETNTTDVQSTSKSEDDDEEKRGVTRTILLTVPLFCKFVIVLLIKFVTDLIVFPLLFLYRLAGIGKRKFFKLIGKGPDTSEKINGEP